VLMLMLPTSVEDIVPIVFVLVVGLGLVVLLVLVLVLVLVFVFDIVVDAASDEEDCVCEGLLRVVELESSFRPMVKLNLEVEVDVIVEVEPLLFLSAFTFVPLRCLGRLRLLLLLFDCVV